jgi:hypothetical protein
MINMSTCIDVPNPAIRHDVFRTGLLMGLAGGSAEILVIWLYSAATGGDATMVARHVALAAGFDGTSVAGVAVHMGLAVALGFVLSAVVQSLTALLTSDGRIWAFMTGSLAAVWAINFFVVLPVVSPGFVHLLPYAITLASKLAFGLAAAAALQGLDTRNTLQGS